MENIEIKSLFFIIWFFILFIIELLLPRKNLQHTRKIRWTRNFSFGILNSLIVKVFIPISLINISNISNEYNYYLFNISNYFNNTFTIIISIIILDFFIYVQHYYSHKINLLWKFHKVHHIDQEIDISTAVRFHPIEIILSFFYKGLIIIIFHIPIDAIIIFEILLISAAMFNHSNINIPITLDRILSKFIITPNLHLVHHSDIPKETDSNYGFNLSIWDIVFKTLIIKNKDGYNNVNIGLKKHKNINKTNFLKMLLCK